MSRTSHSSRLQMLTAATLLGVASLIVPAKSQAQIVSSSQALLNHSTAGIPVWKTGPTVWNPGAEDLAGWFAGEVALLGRVPPGSTPVLQPGDAAASDPADVIDGERALRGTLAAYSRRTWSHLKAK
jgi:hypothetical protein